MMLNFLDLNDIFFNLKTICFDNNDMFYVNKGCLHGTVSVVILLYVFNFLS